MEEEKLASIEAITESSDSTEETIVEKMNESPARSVRFAGIADDDDEEDEVNGDDDSHSNPSDNKDDDDDSENNNDDNENNDNETGGGGMENETAVVEGEHEEQEDDESSSHIVESNENNAFARINAELAKKILMEKEKKKRKKEKKEKKDVIQGMSKKKLKAFKEQYEKRGVVYLSRVPPFMRIQKLRFLLSQYGELDRIYLTPEDKAVTRRRTKLKGKRGVKYEDGWVEFLDKKTAKKVARALNNTKMGGKKGNYYHDDIWNIKYLKGFKWNHLTEKIAHEKQVRHQVIRNEMTEAKQESRHYLDQVQKKKQLGMIQDKRAKQIAKRKREGKDVSQVSTKRQAFTRSFKQREML